MTIIIIFLAEPLPDPTKFTQREGEADKHARRRKLADMEAEYNAVTCVAVYMLLMSFSQKGIDKLRNHQEHMKMRHPDGDFVVSEGFDVGMPFFTLLSLSLLCYLCLLFSLLACTFSCKIFLLTQASLLFPALSWFKEHFIKCNDRAALVKTWLPMQYDGPKSWLDQLVYDRALVLVCCHYFWRIGTYLPQYAPEPHCCKERVTRSSFQPR